jgi:cyclopropane fatty-acyl-phospholipid synthase-like methyltransferase
MPEKIAERFRWVLETLAVEPSDHLLEIGCGHGIAVSLICEKLTSGKIVAIDRSATMIETARRKNADCVTSGKAQFHASTLEIADFRKGSFDKIFAINVNLFWASSAAELDALKGWLRPRGVLHLYYHPPDESKARQLMNSIPLALELHGFSLKEMLSKDLELVRLLCFVAQPASG